MHKNGQLEIGRMEIGQTINFTTEKTQAALSKNQEENRQKSILMTKA